MKLFGNATQREFGLEWQKNLMVKRATAYQEALIDEGFSYEGHVYQIDDGSLSVMNRFMSGLLAGFANPHKGYYRTKDNKHVSMTDEQLALFIQNAAVYTGNLRSALHNAKDVIRACATHEELAAVDFKSIIDQGAATS